MSIASFLSSLGLLGKDAYLRDRARLVKRRFIDPRPLKPSEPRTNVHIHPALLFSSGEAFCGMKRKPNDVDVDFDRSVQGRPTWRIDSFYCGPYGVNPSTIREWACPDCLKVLDAVATFDPRPIKIRSVI